ncbi:MAG: dihydropteroate synthase [Candidatus Omnitrophica bacterium]|nr:dihydropteroate synthase [Candidatus Omnitrophota bacterium]
MRRSGSSWPRRPRSRWSLPPALPNRCPPESSKLGLTCGSFQLPLGERTLLMGILNVTPDSFSDGGLYLNPRRAVSHALRLQEEGADLIDVGGESTRPGARPVSAEEEMRRILPVIERLAGRLKVPISVDTWKAKVAGAAIRAGAALVNDVTALRDPRMPELVARAEVPVILMHMRGTPRTMQRRPRYRRLIPEIIAELKASLAKARAAGIRKNRILLDPGIGFGKGLRENLLLLKNLSAFKRLGYPLVIGPSRKSFIGHLLGTPPHAAGGPSGAASDSGSHDRLMGTTAAVALGVAHGADIVRVHDVAAMRRVAGVADAILRAAG